MNKEQGLALFAEGRDAWNEWARARQAERDALKKAGTWNEQRGAWNTAAAADFSDHEFGEDADFTDLVFPANARFNGASFAGYARFDGASFAGEVRFSAASFARYARFVGASFGGHAGFDQVMFDGTTEFDGATFEKTASFQPMDGRKNFSLARVTFKVLPNFIQAHFTEAPRLDNVRIEPRRLSWPRWSSIKASFKGDADRTARWVALKRLAILGYDHVSEQLFFKGELKSRRWSPGYRWRGAFWFGLIYQLFSDFGRSMVRPLVWWGLGIVGFAVLYLGEHPAVEGRESAVSATCIAAPGEPWSAALGLSLRNGLVLPGIGSNFKLSQIYRCLYGTEPYLAGRSWRPMIADGVAFLGLVQNLYSAALIFLFLLAVRNHFRIR